jgi:hypothetical protein
MEQPIRFIGMDLHKDTIVVAVAAIGDVGKALPYGTFPNTAAALEKLVKRLRQAGSGPLTFCYEAGPCGWRRGSRDRWWSPRSRVNWRDLSGPLPAVRRIPWDFRRAGLGRDGTGEPRHKRHFVTNGSERHHKITRPNLANAARGSARSLRVVEKRDHAPIGRK